MYDTQSIQNGAQFREQLARHFHGLTQIPREEIFGSEEAICRPLNLHKDARTMFAGYVGRNYRKNRDLLLLAINPGGGGDKYTHRTAEDEVFYPLLMDFKGASDNEILSSFESVNASFVPIVRGWNLWRIIEPALLAAGKTLDEIAYMNVVPYRTRTDKMPRAAVRRISWRIIVEPTLQILAPKALITLGKKAGSVVDALLKSNSRTYCIPRTIGDSYVSEEAQKVLMRVRHELRNT
jgi:hypothetical protein